MSGPTREKYYERIIRRDGEHCFIGTEPLPKQTSVIDHWDNNNSNNRLSNLHILCRSMNTVKNARGPGKKTDLLSLSVRKPRPIIITTPELVANQSAEYLHNRMYEPLFRHWLFYNIVHCVELRVNEVVDSGAEFAHCSTITIQRYLQKLTSHIGLYKYSGSEADGGLLIRLKPLWESFRERNEQRRKLNEQSNNWKADNVPIVPRETDGLIEPPF